MRCMGFHVGAQDSVNLGLIAPFTPEPFQDIGIECMVTSALPRGQITLAAFQNSALVARASTSASMPLRMLAALARRSFFQSVPRLPCLAFEGFPVCTPFVRFRAPCRDNPSFIVVPVGVDDRNFESVDYADRVHPNFPVIKTIVNLFECRSLKNPHRIFNATPCRFKFSRYFLLSQL